MTPKTEKLDLHSAMFEKWEKFKTDNSWLLFEYPKIRAAEASMDSVRDPKNAEKREKALVEIARLETTNDILKKTAALFGVVF